ncbi:MAG: transmembrane 220 family protein [SAR324 cluster bacterium]|nr:transmembrane 220 family protein [SAR324 cluster bacterium]
MHSSLWKYLNIVMLVLFLLSVFVQYNDPDPLQWMAVYGLSALACLLYSINRLQWWVSSGIGTIALTWAGFLVPQISDSTDEISVGAIFGTVEMKTVGVELSRELGGLMIVACWMALITILDFYQKSETRS